MQVPGPTLIVTEGDAVHGDAHERLPTAAGNTSILFPGLTAHQHSRRCAGPADARGDRPAATVTYTLIADTPGTHSYYSGTQGDLQIEMGLYGAIIVLPSSPSLACCNGTQNDAARAHAASDKRAEADFRLANAAYNHAGNLLRPRVPVPVFRDRPGHPSAGGGAGRRQGQAAGQRCAQATGCLAVSRPSRITPRTS